MGAAESFIAGATARSAIEDRRAAREAAYRQGMARLSETQRHNSAVEARMQETADTMKGYRSDQATHMATGDARQAAIEARVAQEKQQGELAKPFDEKFAGSAPEEFTQGRSLSREIPTALDSPSMVFPPFDVTKGQQMPGDVKLGPSPKEDAQNAYDTNLTAFNQKKGAAEQALAAVKGASKGKAPPQIAQKELSTIAKLDDVMALAQELHDEAPKWQSRLGPGAEAGTTFREKAPGLVKSLIPGMGSGEGDDPAFTQFVTKGKDLLAARVNMLAGSRPAEGMQRAINEFHAHIYDRLPQYQSRLKALIDVAKNAKATELATQLAGGRDTSGFAAPKAEWRPTRTKVVGKAAR